MRNWAVGAGVALVLGLVAGCTGPVDDDPAACHQQLQVDQAAIRTTPPSHLTHLPGTGAYVAVHWQAHALGDPCSRAPGPTDWSYQQVIELSPADTTVLTSGYGWVAGTVEVWPDLRSYVPTGADWERSDGFDHALNAQAFLDRRHRTVVVVTVES